MGRTARGIVATFDALIMIAAAYTQTGARLDVAAAHLAVWGAAIAAAVCAGVVLAGGPAVLAWASIGYILFDGLLADDGPHWVPAALAVALMPLVPRPRGSFAAGLAITAAVAIGTRLALTALR